MNYIINPENNESYSIFSEKGKALLKNYIKMFQTGGSSLEEYYQHTKGAGDEKVISHNFICKHKCGKYNKKGQKRGQIASKKSIKSPKHKGKKYEFNKCTRGPNKGDLKNYNYQVLEYCPENSNCNDPLYIKSFYEKGNIPKVILKEGKKEMAACSTERNDDDYDLVESPGKIVLNKYYQDVNKADAENTEHMDTNTLRAAVLKSKVATAAAIAAKEAVLQNKNAKEVEAEAEAAKEVAKEKFRRGEFERMRQMEEKMADSIDEVQPVTAMSDSPGFGSSGPDSSDEVALPPIDIRNSFGATSSGPYSSDI